MILTHSVYSTPNTMDISEHPPFPVNVTNPKFLVMRPLSRSIISVDPPAQLSRRIRNFILPKRNLDIFSALEIASRKIVPVVSTLLDTTNKNFITDTDLQHVEDTQNIVVDIIDAFKEVGIDYIIELQLIKFNNYKSDSKIYVDTPLLLGILELYDAVEGIRAELEALFRNVGIHSFVQTDPATLSSCSRFSRVPHLANAVSSIRLLNRDYLVMRSKSTLDTAVADEKLIRTVQSDTSLQDLNYTVTSTYGARDIIVRCIDDLQGVSDYLGIPKKDASTDWEEDAASGTPAETKDPDKKTNAGDDCPCEDCVGSEGNDQVVICIKGCDENEGDVQIVIRNCPDCKEGKSKRDESPASKISSTPESAEDFLRAIESKILHNKGSSGSVTCSDEEDEDDDCTPIKMYETKNLCVKTATGEELVISLTVSPKGIEAEQKQFYYVSERAIPLSRTRVCSSLNFDVSTEYSKLRDKGIDNTNNKIVVQLKNFGADNLLRACRPARCCRKAILNERAKKCLPYAASIRSLPLDDDDMEVIDQSLKRSRQKVRNSNNLSFSSQNYRVHTVMHFVVLNQQYIKKKLDYYIHLADDPVQYCIMYFYVEYPTKNSVDDILNSKAKKKIASKIPVYIGSTRKPIRDVYRVSLSSGTSSRPVSTDENGSKPSATPSKLKTCARSMAWNSLLGRTRRKKREFYCSRSRSDTTLDKSYVKRDLSIFTVSKQLKKKESNDEGKGKVVLDYFTRKLYELIKQEGTIGQSWNSLSLQTSLIIFQTSQCQTSRTLLKFLLNQSSISMDQYCYKKLQLFEQQFDNNDDSCNKVEAFIVEQKSSVDLSRSPSVRPSELSSDTYHLSEMRELKEVLERYETTKMVMKESLPDCPVDPIEYFVYNMCACPAPKKQSVLQKLMSKTKELFSSVDRDICKKYRQQRAFMGKEDKDHCEKCGCSISQCNPPPNQLHCACPKEKKTKPHGICSIFTSMSRSSIKVLKKSVTSLLSKKCNCDKSTATAAKPQQGEKSICVPSSLKVVICDKKSAATETVRDSATQNNCSCDKCDRFNEDGTCCCSHCLGCRDKSVDTEAPKDTETSEQVELEDEGKNKSETSENDNNEDKGTITEDVATASEDGLTDEARSQAYFLFSQWPRFMSQLSSGGVFPAGFPNVSIVELGEDVSE